MTLLGVNIDHVATLRQARGESFPDPVEAALLAVKAGADGITAHLREDRRHIQDGDMERLKSELVVPLNMEMAAAPEIIAIAENLKPTWACLVPEKRQELTTEGGLDVDAEFKRLQAAIHRLHEAGTKVSLFISPDEAAVSTAKELGADAVELHTGTYAKRFRADKANVGAEISRLGIAANQAKELGLLVNAGHGLDLKNVAPLLREHSFNELNIGFSIIARSVFVGIESAVREMKEKLR